MPAYKVYAWERERWPEYREVKLTLNEATRYVRKLCRHFKLGMPYIRGGKHLGAADYSPGFWKNIETGFYDFDGRIRFTTNDISLGTVCHEFAHHLNYKRNGNGKGKWHGKTFKRELKRVFTWAKRYLPEKVETELPTSGIDKGA